MKRFLLFIACLGLISLACLQSAAIGGQPVAVSTAASDYHAPTSESFVKVDPTLSPTSSPSPNSKSEFGEGNQAACATVIAIESLHLRQEASESSLHLAYMVHGEVVQVINRSDLDWWFVQYAGKSGYARAVYLQESECAK